MHIAVLIGLTLVAIASVGRAHTLAAAHNRGHLSLLLALDAVLVLLFSVGVWEPSTFETWMQEDSWIEWATVFSFGGGAFLFGRQALRATATRQTWSRIGLAAIAAFCVFVAGEEVSWGQRLLAFQPPDVFLEDNYQQELNVHNFLKDETLFGFPLDTRFVVALIAAGYGVLLPILVATVGRDRASWIWNVLSDVSPPQGLVFAFATIAWVELSYPIKLCGEAAELVLGLCFLATAWMRDPSNGEQVRVGAILIPLALIAGLLTQPVVDRLVYGADEERVAEARDELQAIVADVRDPELWKRKKWRKKKRVHKRMFSAMRSGYLRMDENSTFLEGQGTPADRKATNPRHDRRGYLLDPWSNPYWIHFQSKSDVILIYSFGPNRRRDSSLRSEDEVGLDAIQGDDVAVYIRVDAVLPNL